MKTDIPPEIEKLLLAIEQNELVLPTMPDWAVKIQRMLDDINVSASQIVTAISADPVFAAQLIKSANSAIYSDKPRVVNVMAAVSRLGYKALRNLVMKITMTRLANASHPVIRKHLSEFMVHSRDVAAISYVLAREQKHLNPDQAMLAGLIHDIGMIPICLYADKNMAEVDEQTCSLFVRKYQGKIGEQLLTSWAFPQELIEVPVAHENLQRDTGNAPASYTDIVTVANLLAQPTAKFVAWDNVTAINKLGMSADVCREFHDRFGNEVQSTRELLFDN